MSGKFKLVSLIMLLSIVLLVTGCDVRQGDSVLLKNEIEETSQYAFVLEYGAGGEVPKATDEALEKLEKTNGLASGVVLGKINELGLDAGDDDHLLLYDNVVKEESWTLLNADGDVDELLDSEVSSKLNDIIHGGSNVVVVLVVKDDIDDVVDVRSYIENNHREIGTLMDKENVRVMITR